MPSDITLCSEQAVLWEKQSVKKKWVVRKQTTSHHEDKCKMTTYSKETWGRELTEKKVGSIKNI